MNEKELLEQGYKKYRGEEMDIYFSLALCEHAGICIRGDREVFNLRRKPWILPDLGPQEEVQRLIAQCPSKALKYRMKDSEEIFPQPHPEETRYQKEESGRKIFALKGSLQVGIIEFHREGEGLLVITRTEVDPAYSGQFIGNGLVKQVVNVAEEENRKILSLCSFARKVITRIPAYRHLEHKLPD